MTFIPDERDYEAAKKDPAFARASDANKYRLAFVEQMIRLFGKGRGEGRVGTLGERAWPSRHPLHHVMPAEEPASDVGRWGVSRRAG